MASRWSPAAGNAAALHRRAAAATVAASLVLDAAGPTPGPRAEPDELASRLGELAHRLAPGWLGAPLEDGPAPQPEAGPVSPLDNRPVPAPTDRLAPPLAGPPGRNQPGQNQPGQNQPGPVFVRIGTGRPADGRGFPAVIPLTGSGHVTVDADATDPRVAGFLRALLLRLLAAAPAGTLLVRGVDATGQVLAPFAPLAATGLFPPPATDRTGLRAVLDEAERWVRPVRRTAPARNRHDQRLLLCIVALPVSCEAVDLARIRSLGRPGPNAGLTMVIAGWPPGAPATGVVQPPLPRATTISLGDRYARVAASAAVPTPTAAAAADEPTGPAGADLGCPVLLDGDPPADLVDAVCRQLAKRVTPAPGPALGELLPVATDDVWTGDATDGLTTVVGRDGATPVTLGFTDLTPHWLLSGHAGAGKSAFLVNVLHGLCARYHPDDLALYLLDFTSGSAFTDLLPTASGRAWLPHLRLVGTVADREFGVAVLRELAGELDLRCAGERPGGGSNPPVPPDGSGRTGDPDGPESTPDALTPTGRNVPALIQRVTGSNDDGNGTKPDAFRDRRLPRIVCVLDGYPTLLAGDGPLAVEALALLDRLARQGRSYGIHLVLAGRPDPELAWLRGRRGGLFGQCLVRVALPGGGEVLEATNDSAAALPLGTAVVNTAGGLGGPRGATRGHERLVRFPDPRAHRAVLDALRHRLWTAAGPDPEPPRVFTGDAQPRLDDDPVYRDALAGLSAQPSALVGRTVDAPLSTAAFPFRPEPGRHLAVLGPSPAGADLLAAAARSLAAHHEPGTARFVVASPWPGTDEVAAALVADLADRHRVERVDGPELTRELDLDRPGYLVVFGMDQLDPGRLPAERFRELLRNGPGRGVHLLSWWRGSHRFTEALGRVPAPGDIAGMVFLNVSGAEISLLLGQAVDWCPRQGRALLHDRHTGRTTVIVPYQRHRTAS